MMKTIWDPDIATLNITETEKNGIQVFRNYQKSFDKAASLKFIEETDLRQFDLSPLIRILSILASDDFRFLPVFFCSFADDQLEAMFRREISESVPGGKASLLSGFGGLSRFSQRIQMAFVFQWMSEGLLLETDKIRKVRNDVSHSWDIESLRSKIFSVIDQQIHSVEDQLIENGHISQDELNKIDKDKILRVRLAWLVGRFFYEALLYPTVVKRRLDQGSTLYGTKKPKLLSMISKCCLNTTNFIVSG